MTVDNRQFVPVRITVQLIAKANHPRVKAIVIVGSAIHPDSAKNL
jgi:hypothetical protein